MKKIQVKQEDIDKGRRNVCFDCPIALALRREGYRDVVVGSAAVRISTTVIELPRSARRFINRFDNRKKVQPFNFILEI